HRAIPFTGGWPSGRLPPMGAIDPSALLFQKNYVPMTAASFSEDRVARTIGEHILHDPTTAQEVHVDTFAGYEGLRVNRGVGVLPLLIGVPFASRPIGVVIADRV